jgi:purine-binding chemotaxis protein CheW
MQEQKALAEEKVLTFRLGGETYGIEILKVREIIGLMEITAVPKTASHIRGVINLRGKIVPVIDMRDKFGLPQAELSRENCIITVLHQGEDGDLLVGALVDSVSEVMQLKEGEVDPVPALGGDMKLDFVRGLAKSQGKVSILLDIDKVIRTQDVAELKELGKALAAQA